MLLNKHGFWMAIPAVTREYNPGSHHNSRKNMRLPPQRVMRPNSPALSAQQFHVPNQTRKEPWFVWWNFWESQEHRHKSRMTLISPKECEIVLCNSNQLEMTPECPVLDLEQSPIPHHRRQVSCLTLGNTRDILRHPSQIYSNTNFSRGTRGKHHGCHIILRRERIPRILLKR